MIKYQWRNQKRHTQKVLVDIKTGLISGGIRENSNGTWTGDVYDSSGYKKTTCGTFGDIEHAKRAVNSAYPRNNKEEYIIFDESEIVEEITAKALRNIIACKDLDIAKTIARDVLADPAKWFEEWFTE